MNSCVFNLRAAHQLKDAVTWLLCLLLALAFVRVAYAEPAVGSITLLLGDGSGNATTDMVGGSVSLWRVATVQRDGVNERYDISAGQFSGSTAVAGIPSMDKAELDEQNANIASQLEEEALSAGLDPVAQADIRDGKATFAEVPEGLYLLFQTELSEGGRKMHTFLLSVPSEDGQLNIVAQPKPGVYLPQGDAPGQNTPREDAPRKEKPAVNSQTAAQKAASISVRTPQTADEPFAALPIVLLGLTVLSLGLGVRRLRA